jgi:hypothetical protein
VLSTDTEWTSSQYTSATGYIAFFPQIASLNSELDAVLRRAKRTRQEMALVPKTRFHLRSLWWLSSGTDSNAEVLSAIDTA